MATQEEAGKVLKMPGGVDLDFAFGVLKVLYRCMTDIKEGKIASKAEAAVAEAKGKVEKEGQVEEAYKEPEITFKDAFDALEPVASEAVSEEMVEKEGFDGKPVKVLGSTFEPGIPLERGEWKNRFSGREDEMKYLRTGLRYWYSDDWYGSEKRKKPA